MSDNKFAVAYDMKRRNARKKMADGGMIEAQTPNQITMDTPDAPEQKQKKGGLLSGLGLAHGGEVNPKLAAASEKEAMPKGSHKFYIDGGKMADEIRKKKMSNGGTCMADGGTVDDDMGAFDDDDMEMFSMSHDDLFDVDADAPEVSMDPAKKRKGLLHSIMAEVRAKHTGQA